MFSTKEEFFMGYKSNCICFEDIPIEILDISSNSDILTEFFSKSLGRQDYRTMVDDFISSLIRRGNLYLEKRKVFLKVYITFPANYFGNNSIEVGEYKPDKYLSKDFINSVKYFSFVMDPENYRSAKKPGNARLEKALSVINEKDILQPLLNRLGRVYKDDHLWFDSVLEKNLFGVYLEDMISIMYSVQHEYFPILRPESDQIVVDSEDWVI